MSLGHVALSKASHVARRYIHQGKIGRNDSAGARLKRKTTFLCMAKMEENLAIILNVHFAEKKMIIKKFCVSVNDNLAFLVTKGVISDLSYT